MPHWYQRHRRQIFATGTAGFVYTEGKFAPGVNDTCGKFAVGVNDTSGKFTTSVVGMGSHQLPLLLITRVAQ